MYCWSFLRRRLNYIHLRYSNYFKIMSPNVYIRAYTAYVKPIGLRILEILIMNSANRQASNLVSLFVGKTTVCSGLHYHSATENVTAQNDSIFHLPLRKHCPLETEKVSNCLALQMFLNSWRNKVKRTTSLQIWLEQKHRKWFQTL